MRWPRCEEVRGALAFPQRLKDLVDLAAGLKSRPFKTKIDAAISKKLPKNCKLGLRREEQATTTAQNTGVSPLRRARSRATPVEMTDDG
jgi:hypothetical protein